MDTIEKPPDIGNRLLDIDGAREFLGGLSRTIHDDATVRSAPPAMGGAASLIPTSCGRGWTAPRLSGSTCPTVGALCAPCERLHDVTNADTHHMTRHT